MSGSADRRPAGAENAPSSSRGSRWRATPAVLASALVLTFRAAPILASIALAVQVVSAGSFAILLVLLSRMVTRAGELASAESLWGNLWPDLVLLGVVLTVATSAQCVLNGLRLLVGEQVTWYADERLLDVAVAAEQSTFDTPAFHDRMNRAQMAVGRPAMTIDGLFAVVGGLSSTVSFSAVVVTHGGGLLLVLLCSAVPLLLAESRGVRRLHATVSGLAQLDRRRGYLRLMMTNRIYSAEIRAYCLADHIRSQNRELFSERLGRLKRVIAPDVVLTVLGGAIAALGLTITIYVMVGKVQSGVIGLATASLICVSLLQLNNAFAGLLAGVSRLYENSLFLDDLRAFRMDLQEIGSREHPTALPPERIDHVEVDGVTFRYPGADEPVLRDVSLTLRRGEIVALVGGNGSGKTTLARLMSNAYQPEAGRILWDGHEVRNFESTAVRSSIAVLHQDFVRYLMTVGENIGLGQVDRLRDSDAILQAAQRAGVARFAGELPKGYDTALGAVFTDSVDLSGGQWQRLALARALFRDASLLILDEPTAALDASAERDFFDTLRVMADDRAVVLISHRMTGVRSADRIYVLDDGRIVEQGTHDHLMARDGRYADLQRAHDSTSAVGLH